MLVERLPIADLALANIERRVNELGVTEPSIARQGANNDEILVQLRNGDRRAIVQAKGSETLNPGDAVIIVTTGGKARVTRAPAVQP